LTSSRYCVKNSLIEGAQSSKVKKSPMDAFIMVGSRVRSDVGIIVGSGVGSYVGIYVGTRVGSGVGIVVSIRVGLDVGKNVGTRVGSEVGIFVGACAGLVVGIRVRQPLQVPVNLIVESSLFQKSSARFSSIVIIEGALTTGVLEGKLEGRLLGKLVGVRHVFMISEDRTDVFGVMTSLRFDASALY
jgi:hypothetical protein